MTFTQSDPVVSIGLPVYNGERWLRGALDCLLGQTYRNIELVVCDNASTDATAALCAEYAERDPRVRYFRNPYNVGTRGPKGNFCRVLAHATGEYFMWASADDGRDPTIVERCVTALRRNPHAILAHGSIEVAFRNRRDIVEVSNGMDLEIADPVARIQRFTCEMSHNAMIYGVFRREALLQTRYGNHFGHDWSDIGNGMTRSMTSCTIAGPYR
jgi:glycosyltransferase involved in cell wall biosynthesis